MPSFLPDNGLSSSEPTSSISSPAPSLTPPKKPKMWVRRLRGLALLALALALTLSLGSYNHAEVSWQWLNSQASNPHDNTNLLLWPGLYVAALLYFMFGAAAWWVPSLLGFIGTRRFLYPQRPWLQQWICAVIMLLLASEFWATQNYVLHEWATRNELRSPGGWVGFESGMQILAPLIGQLSVFSLALFLHGIALVLLCDCRFRDIFAACFRRKKKVALLPQPATSEQDEPIPQHSEDLSIEDMGLDNKSNVVRHVEEQITQTHMAHQNLPQQQSAPNSRNRREIEQMARRERMQSHQQLIEETKNTPPLPMHSVREQDTPPPTPASRELQRQIDTELGRSRPEMPPVPAPAPAPPAPTIAPRELQDYPMPPLDLLTWKPIPQDIDDAAREEMKQVQTQILETLQAFGIDALPGDITRGPSITRYEFYPPKGLRVNRIENLRKDIMLVTSAESVNILAPIPGKNTVGIELANRNKTPVFLRELLAHDAFQQGSHRIPVALGKDVYGRPVIGDLAAMPHTLVAGTTGSGKSVCINSMLISILYKFSPQELKLILIDPKTVEMLPYRRLPHLICPVVTEPARVIGALRWAVNEMEHRYKLFSRVGVRNFEDFNNRPPGQMAEEEEEPCYDDEHDTPVDYAAIDAMASEIERQGEDEIALGEEEPDEFDFDADEPIPDTMAYIVIIIDELADLMMVVKEDLEVYISRLTQKARAAGIHLVVATQTPRANVVTGIIKANIPSRIAFKVSSPLDSRIILDTASAENLLGKGDFLFIPPGGPSCMMRAQGAFVSDAEVSSVVAHAARHCKQVFVRGVTAEMNNETGKGAGGSASNDAGRIGGQGMSAEDSELYTRCVNLVIMERKASTSLLQRRFGIGYGRAAKIMDIMEERGIISPPQGATRAREVLVDPPDDLA